MAGQFNDDEVATAHDEVAMVAMTAASTTTCTGWSLDSGCTRHVTSNPEDFLHGTLKTSPRITYQGINGAVDSMHEGDVRLAIIHEQGLPFNITVTRVRLIPKKGKTHVRLLSVRALVEHGCHVSLNASPIPLVGPILGHSR